MNVAFWIATRYLRTRRPTAFIAILTTLSIVGVTVGVAALITVLAVMNGFEREIRTRVAGTNAHVLVLSFDDSGITDTTRALPAIRGVKDVVGVAPFLYRKALATHGNLAEGLVVKGVDLQAERRVTTVASNITPALDSIPLVTPGNVPGVVLGSELADHLRAAVGDHVILASFEGGVRTAAGLVPKLGTFEVVGIFHSGLYEYDANLAYVALPAAADFFGAHGTVTGIEIKVEDLFQAEKVRDRVLKKLGGFPYRGTDWIEMNANLFSFMKVEKGVMALILGLIMLVAALNIVSTLLMVVLVKRRDIGSLLTQGASPSDVLRIFLFEGMLIGVVGTGLGTGLGLVLCRVLHGYHIPADVYFLSALPVQLEWSDVIWVALAALVLCAVAALYPAAYAARIPPAEAIRET
ncbi:MAG TPA: FtsX-like permease family protein [Candidatus Eisenbacteria bacterium]|nr:FtsX-like permease family protein [Candidatus Eisenbacteria bacterium]